MLLDYEENQLELWVTEALASSVLGSVDFSYKTLLPKLNDTVFRYLV